MRNDCWPGLEKIDWSESLKEMQRNWIGRSEGAEVQFRLEDDSAADPGLYHPARHFVRGHLHGAFARTQTGRCHHHPGGNEPPWPPTRLKSPPKATLERTETAREKTGVFTGAFAINPVNREKIPIWIADYVLATYGTGAIMAVPAHDERDLEFARKFKLPIRVVVQAPEGRDSIGFTGDGTSVNSDFITGLPTPEAKEKITRWLEERKLGRKTINYKLRDWLFSRQRYWGEPFPIIWKEDAAGRPLP